MLSDAKFTPFKASSTTKCGSNAVPIVDLYQCGKCQTMLGRHRFPKNLFRKLVIVSAKNIHNKESNKKNTKTKNTNSAKSKKKEQLLVCHQCRRLETANRCKQAPPRLLKHDSTVADSGMKRRPNNFGYCDYVDKLFGMECFATHIAPLKVFSSAKDVSESMAAIHAVFKHGTIHEQEPTPNERGILCLCIGDGCTPRTALLMAFLAKKRESWECVSIDPALSEEWAHSSPSVTKGVRGLHGYKGTLKEFLGDPKRPPSIESEKTPQRQQRWRHLVLVCVHSHARFVEEASIENIRSLYSTQKSGSGSGMLIPTTIVSLPCCPTFRHVRDIGISPTLKYDDDCVFSACRSVEIWNLEEEEAREEGNANRPGHFVAITSASAYCSEDLTFLPNGSSSMEGVPP